MPKANEPKERAPSHLSTCGGCPVLLEVAGSLKTRFAQTVQPPFSATSAVLGCVTMGKGNMLALQRCPLKGGFLRPSVLQEEIINTMDCPINKYRDVVSAVFGG